MNVFSTRTRAALAAKPRIPNQRLARKGADLEVIQTLQSMIRGDSVVLVAEQSRTGGAVGASLAKPHRLPSFRSQLMTDLGMSYEAATDYMERYNAMVDHANAVAVRYASGAASSVADDVGDATDTATYAADTSAPLGGAQLFEYTPDDLSDDATEVAARGVSMTGNEPGGYRINPNGQDVDYFDGDGTLCAQYHASHDPAHGHNFDEGVRDNNHLAMSPINCQ